MLRKIRIPTLLGTPVCLPIKIFDLNFDISFVSNYLIVLTHDYGSVLIIFLSGVKFYFGEIN